MVLAPGSRLGPYEIIAAVGAGGMGEVYRARDTKLGRDVALKILPAAFASDPDRLARFHREAQVLASLNHPHIGAIYGFEDSGETHALVLEFVDGPTLADRIAQGPIPLDEALPIATQIAEALEAAHEQGIIHRDLKPANIKLKPDGTVKVLDFGLAKLAESAGSGQPVTGSALSMSPTITSPAMMTGVGVLLGTAAYMSPEQARGKAVDKRADIWAFGCIVYEMLTGERAFAGNEVTDTIAFIITKEPDWTALPDVTPPVIRRLLRRCLEKDRQRRLPDVGVARLDIDEALAAPANETIRTGTAAPQPVKTAWRRAVPWTVASASLVVAGATLWVSAPWRSTSQPALQRLSVELGADTSLLTDQGAAAIISPDGQTLAFVAQPNGAATSQLYVRRLDQLQAQPLTGGDGARDPFFSPDGRWIGFFAGGKLKKISAGGGAAVTLADAPNSRGAVWAADDSIVFQPINAQPAGSDGGPLLRVSSSGGRPEQLTKLVGDEVTHRWPQVLPGGKAVLFTVHNTTLAGYEDANIVVQSLAEGTRKVLVRGGYFARYLPSGHLVYMHEGTVFAVPFDVESLAVEGQAVPAIEGVATNTQFGGAQFAVSSTGTLVYVAGSSFYSLEAPVSWMDRKGAVSVLRRTPARWSNPQFSPDGRVLAIDIAGGSLAAGDVWTYDLGRDTLSRLTFDGTNRKPVWSPDGQRIVFSSRREDDAYNLYWQHADGTGDVQRLTESRNPQYAASWHPSGKFLAFFELNGQASNDLMIVPLEGNEASGWKPGKAFVFLATPAGEREPVFSPDGRWIAYSSTESGPAEVYVRPFPGPGGKWQISTGGGDWPTWSRAGRELFYHSPDGHIMVVPYTVEGNSLRADRPRAVADTRHSQTPLQRPYALHPDSQRFAIAPIAGDGLAKQDKVVLVFNFFDELRRLAPIK
jgi:serine/threonine protein kinase/Tol biopolymer transport system component